MAGDPDSGNFKPVSDNLKSILNGWCENADGVKLFLTIRDDDGCLNVDLYDAKESVICRDLGEKLDSLLRTVVEQITQTLLYTDVI